MSISTLNSKGQITIPKNIQEHLHLNKGDKIEIQIENDGTARIIPLTLKPSDVFGILSSKTKIKSTVKEMNNSISEMFKESEL